MNQNRIDLPRNDPIGIGALAYEDQLKVEQQRAVNDSILAGEAHPHAQYVPLQELQERLQASCGLTGWEDGFDRILEGL